MSGRRTLSAASPAARHGASTVSACQHATRTPFTTLAVPASRASSHAYAGDHPDAARPASRGRWPLGAAVDAEDGLPVAICSRRATTSSMNAACWPDLRATSAQQVFSGFSQLVLGRLGS